MTLRPSNLLKSTLFRDSATLVSGNVIAQVISLLAYLLLTRIYSPPDYALFNIFYSYIEVLIILSTCKYELAIVVGDDEHESSAIARFSLRLNTWVSLGLLTLVAVLYLTGSLPGNFSRLGILTLLIPPMVFFSGTSRVYAALFNRVRHYREIAASDVANSASGALLKILFGLAGMFRSGMPLGTVLGQALANLVYRFRIQRLHLPKVTRRQRLDAARHHRNFPLYVASKDLINSISTNLPFLWLAHYFNQVEVGLFALALTFTFRPVNILNNAFDRVLYARCAELVRERKSIAHIIWRFLLLANLIALPVALLAWFTAEPIFTFFFSGKWSGCGIYVQTMLPWFFLLLSSGSLMFISNIFATQRVEFYVNLLLLVLRASAIGIGIHMGSFLLAIQLFSAVSCMVAAGLLIWYLAQMRRYERYRSRE